MKNTILKNICLLWLLLAGGIYANAQVISYPTAAQSISRGLDSSLLTIKIDFPACTGVKIRVNLGAINSPGSIEYIPGSVAKIAGTPSLNITESDISDLSSPEFDIGNTAIGESITFTISRKANCGSASSTKDNIEIISDGMCNTLEADSNSNNYNLLAPALTFVPPNPMLNTVVGSTYSRNFRVTNGGLGCLDTLGLWIVYPHESVQLNSLSIGAFTLTPSYTNGDSSYFIVTGSVLGAGNKLCNTGSAIIFTENFTILKCDVTTRYGTAWYAHDGTVCQTIGSSSILTMTNNLPLLTTTIPTPNHDICYAGERVLQQLRITNTGIGPATELALYARSGVPSSHESQTYPDTSRPWTVRNAMGDSIGVIRNFEIITNPFPMRNYYSSSCTVAPTPSEVKGYGSIGVIVPAGSYVTVDMYYKAQNFSCSYFQNCPSDAYSFVSINTALDYKNSCRTASYTEQYKNHFNRSYGYFRNTLEVPSDIHGNTPFSLIINASVFRTVNKIDGSGSSYIAIAVGNSGIVPNAATVSIKTVNYPMTLNATNDTILIGPLLQNQTLDNLTISVPLIAHCGTGGTKSIGVTMLDRYSTCAPWIRLGCKSTTTNLHCPQPCPKGGATPTKFTLLRTSYGQPDNNNDHIPDPSGAINLLRIDQKKSVNGDTLQGTWNIRLTPNVDPSDPNVGQAFRYVYIDFDLGANAASQAAATLTALPNAIVQIYPNGTPTPTPITCTISPTIVGTGGRYAHYEIGPACRGANFGPNDSIVFRASYTVNYYNAVRYSYNNTASPTTFFTRNEVYAAYTPKTTNQTAPSLGQTYTCDHYNDYNQIVGIQQSIYIPPAQLIKGCTNNLSAHYRQYTRSQEGPTIFPYEVRTFGWLDTMKITLPPGFIYRNNSGYFNAIRYNAVNAAATTPNISAASTGVSITQSGNILTVANIKTIYSAFGGTLSSSDEQEDVRFYFAVDPTCEATDGTYPNQLWASSVGNGVNTPTVYRRLDSHTYGSVNGWIYTAPIPTLNGGGILTSSDGTATWDIVLQNQSNSIPAGNSYFYISPKNGFTNIVVRSGAITIMPDLNGFYRLGTLAASANNSYTITARTTTCGTDSMAINYGWGCSGTPTSFSETDCLKKVWLKLDNYPSQIQLTVDKQPQTPTLDFCNTDYVEFSINSAAGGFADNPRFLITPPAGVNIISGEIEYPYGSGVWQTITPSVSGGVYTYRVEDHTGVQTLWGGKGLPGVIDNPGAENRKAKLRITYSTTCGFINNSRFMAQQQADRPCGDPIPVNLGYNNSVRTNSITLTGVVSTGVASFSLNVTEPAQKCDNYTVSGYVSMLGSPTTSGDTILITIPNQLNYVNGSFTATTVPGLTLSAPGAYTGTGGTTILKLAVPAGIPSGTPIGLQYQLVPKTASGCGTFPILSDYIRTTLPFACASPPYTCTAGSQNIIGNDSLPMTVTKAMIRAFSFQTVWDGGPTAEATVTLINDGTTPQPPGIIVEFFCGTNTTPFQSWAFPRTIPAGNIQTDNVTLDMTAVTCSTSDIIRAVVRPGSSPEQCLCDSSAVYGLMILPAKLESFTARKVDCNVALDWKVGDNTNVSYYAVEYSENGRDFTDIGRVNPINGQFNYAYNTGIREKVTYYRLKVVDHTLVERRSNTVMVNAGSCSPKSLVIYPNPAVNYVNIDLNGYRKNVLGRLYNVQGQMVGKFELNNGSNRISITGLANGIYNLVVWDGETNHETYKIRIGQ